MTHIIIITHDRPEMLRDLLADLDREFPGAPRQIWHDGPRPKGYEGIEATYTPHHGKRRFSHLFNRVVNEAPKADLYLFLPDDIRLKEGTGERLLQEWADIDDPRKGVYNCLNDMSRTGLPNWTARPATVENIHSLRTFWWDGCGFVHPEVMRLIKANPIQIDPKRWDNNPGLSSGVGEWISRLCAKKGVSMFQTRSDDIDHIGDRSKMNARQRRTDPLRSWRLEPIIAGMATIAGREKEATLAMASIINQVDQLYVVFNNCEPSRYAVKHPRIIPILGNNQIGDGEKFRGLEKTEYESYYFLSLDDDLIYPQDYVWRMVHGIERNERRAVMTVHGKVLPKRVTRFYGGHTAMYHTKEGLLHDRQVNCPGTCTTAWHSSTLKFGCDDIKAPNMGDIWISKACAEQGVSIISIARQKGWLQIMNVKETIYEQHHRAGHEQTKIWNEIWK